MRHCLNMLLWIILLQSGGSSRALALDLGLGLAAVDNMSDGAEPAATARVGWDGFYAQFYYWGRDYGPVSERNGLLSLAGETSVGGSKFLVAHYGLDLLDHQVNLYGNHPSRSGTNPPTAVHENDPNVGGILGLALHLNAGPLLCTLSWDSHIFFTGSGFIVFLASARKQSVSLLLGVDL